MHAAKQRTRGRAARLAAAWACAGLAGLAGLAGCHRPATFVPGLDPAARAADAMRSGPAPAPRPASAQDREPLDALALHLDGFHAREGHRDATAATHEWCTPVDAEFAQCVVFDDTGPYARLIGVEYVISERAWRRLPDDERRLWHAHAWDVTSGTLAAPDLAGAAERDVMRSVAHTYGKAWSTWRPEDGDRLPVGVPQRLTGFTGDGQIDARAVAARDQRLGRSSAVRARDRLDLLRGTDAPAPAPRLALDPPSADAPRTLRSAESADR